MKAPPEHTLFELLGLNEKEQAVYLAALELGESLQLPLAQKAGIKRTTLRELVPNLIAQGVLGEIVKGGRRFLVAKDPRELLGELRQKLDKASDAIPQLLAVQNALAAKPVVRYFEGVEGVKQVYMQTLLTGQPIYSFVTVEEIHPDIQPWLSSEYSREREKRKIWAYNITNDAGDVQQIMPASTYRENKFVSAKRFPFRMEVLAFGDFVAYIHFRKNDSPSAVLIQSQAAAITMRSIHQLFWQ